MRYSDNLDFLLASIIYLATHEYYWARSPKGMAEELSLDENRLQTVFSGFPGIFRESVRVSPENQHYYSLQARYAQREGGETRDPEEVFYIKPLDLGQIQLLITFITHSAEQEIASRRSNISVTVSMLAAVVSALAAIGAAIVGIRTGAGG